jgi:hypothetical protein
MILQGCGAVINDHLFGKYYLIAVDDDHQLSLSFRSPEYEETYLTIVPATVFAIGYNERYFIVKQHPYLFSNAPINQITNYYIYPITGELGKTNTSGLIGPLTLSQFLFQRKKLNIPDSLIFTKEYGNLK